MTEDCATVECKQNAQSRNSTAGLTSISAEAVATEHVPIAHYHKARGEAALHIGRPILPGTYSPRPSPSASAAHSDDVLAALLRQVPSTSAAGISGAVAAAAGPSVSVPLTFTDYLAARPQ